MALAHNAPLSSTDGGEGASLLFSDILFSPHFFSLLYVPDRILRFSDVYIGGKNISKISVRLVIIVRLHGSKFFCLNRINNSRSHERVWDFSRGYIFYLKHILY